jgi:hypothetical protein
MAGHEQFGIYALGLLELVRREFKRWLREISNIVRLELRGDNHPKATDTKPPSLFPAA